MQQYLDLMAKVLDEADLEELDTSLSSEVVVVWKGSLADAENVRD